jgi:hypothetical protein
MYKAATTCKTVGCARGGLWWLQAGPRLQGGQQWQVQEGAIDPAQVLERPDILAAAAANLGLGGLSWPSIKPEQGTSSAFPPSLPAATNGAMQLGGAAPAAALAAALASVSGQPHTQISAGTSLGRPGEEGWQQDRQGALLAKGPSAAHLLLLQQGGPAASAAPRGLVDLVSAIAHGQTVSAAGCAQHASKGVPRRCVQRASKGLLHGPPAAAAACL